MVTVSALATTLFLGGWRAPWPISLSGRSAQPRAGGRGACWFVGKLLLFIFVFIWLRGTLPRLRYDQFMQLGWKVLIPVASVWILVVAAVRALNQRYDVRHPTGPARRWRDRRGADRAHLRLGPGGGSP